MGEHRLCKNVQKINDLSKFNIINDIFYVAKINIIHHSKSEEFIKQNLKEFLKLMICNIFMRLKLSIQNNFEKREKYDCINMSNIINILNNILFVIDCIQNKLFYNFELIFLLQNNYFYRKNQINKYKDICTQMIEKNPALQVHQFMMGKGKTSVITPLLSFAVNLLGKKQPTIITMEHLITQTRKYISMTEFFSSIKVNIFSDSIAKKRWLEQTDKMLRITNASPDINLTEEYNIIDEFDTHYNYLQSMFNYVTEEDYTIIDYNYFIAFIYMLDSKYLETVLTQLFCRIFAKLVYLFWIHIMQFQKI